MAVTGSFPQTGQQAKTGEVEPFITMITGQ